MNVKANASTTTKITALTPMNVSALEGHGEELKVDLGKTTATFEGDPAAALARVRKVQAEVAAKQGGRHTTVASLHAVARKLEKAATAAKKVQPQPVKQMNEDGSMTVEPKLTLVLDSTDKSSNPKGVFGETVADAVKKERTRRETKTQEFPVTVTLTEAKQAELAQKEADAIASVNATRDPASLSKAERKQVETYQKTAAAKLANQILSGLGYELKQEEATELVWSKLVSEKPGWGTARTHKLEDGDVVLYFGKDSKLPATEGKAMVYRAHVGAGNSFGGVATRVWAIKLGEIGKAPTSDEKNDRLRHDGTTQKVDLPAGKKATPAKKAAPAKKPALVKDGIAYGSSGPACHGLKVGDKFTYHGNDKKTGPTKTGKKLTLQITDRIWIEGVDSKGVVGMRVHIAGSFWAKKA